jgi:hypothetical protein
MTPNKNNRIIIIIIINNNWVAGPNKNSSEVGTRWEIWIEWIMGPSSSWPSSCDDRSLTSALMPTRYKGMTPSKKAVSQI